MDYRSGLLYPPKNFSWGIDSVLVFMVIMMLNGGSTFQFLEGVRMLHNFFSIVLLFVTVYTQLLYRRYCVD